MRTWILVALLALATAAGADVIRKWKTPDGSLHLGDNPPPGSVLLETIELPDSAPAAEPSPETDALARAAADGREIIKRRAAEREAERARGPAGLEDAVVSPESTNVIVVNHGVPFFPDHPRFSFRDDLRFRRLHDDGFAHRDFFAGGGMLSRQRPAPRGHASRGGFRFAIR